MLSSPFSKDPKDIVIKSKKNAPNDKMNQLILNNIGTTEKVAENIDLLQDHLEDVGSLVGIDINNFMNFHGTDEDREALLNLMQSETPHAESDFDQDLIDLDIMKSTDEDI
jgi:hypothetical protein